MAGYRKLGRTSSQRKALLRNQVTSLLYHGKIVTTEAKAKEIRKIAEHMIALAVKEKDNYETVTVQAKVAQKDKDGKRVKEVVDGKPLRGGAHPLHLRQRPDEYIPCHPGGGAWHPQRGAVFHSLLPGGAAGTACGRED